MGVCGSKITEEEAREREINDAFDQQNREDAIVESQKVKLLLLGAGESGKSTIFKQMKHLYGSPLTVDEKKQITNVVFANIIQTMKILCDQVQKLGFADKFTHEEARDFIIALKDETRFDSEAGKHMKDLWRDEAIQAAWKKRSKFSVLESSAYFFDKVDELATPDYIVSDRDVLMARVRTTGIVEESYVVNGVRFCIFDVGGQRNERKKWIHCFEEVTAVIFVAALSEYDQHLFEDSSMNRMVEAIQLFDEVCNNKYFTESSMILFLNKRDLFDIKIRVVNINEVECFDDYTGGLGDFEKGCEFFLQKFLSKNKTPFAREIYYHVTCATDMENVRVVFDACRDIILQANVNDSGL